MQLIYLKLIIARVKMYYNRVEKTLLCWLVLKIMHNITKINRKIKLVLICLSHVNRG